MNQSNRVARAVASQRPQRVAVPASPTDEKESGAFLPWYREEALAEKNKQDDLDTLEAKIADHERRDLCGTDALFVAKAREYAKALREGRPADDLYFELEFIAENVI